MHLAAGFGNGKIILWDLIRKSLCYTIRNSLSSSVLSVRFLKVPKLWIISSYRNGSTFITEFDKDLFHYKGNIAQLLDNYVGYSIAPLYENPIYKSPLDDFSLIAIGGVDSVVAASLEPHSRILWEIKRNPNIKKTIAYVDWGRGILPNKETPGSLILAIAWDRIVQLVEVSGDYGENREFNGYYESECEIQSLWWLASSVILILDSRNEMRLLYSSKMTPGEYDGPNFNKINIESSELERAYTLPDTLIFQPESIYDLGKEDNIKNTYIQTFSLKGNEVVGLGNTSVIHGKLLRWTDYLDNFKGEKFVEGLRVSLEIYYGRLKGFAGLSEESAVRETGVKNYMNKYLKESLVQCFEKLKNKRVEYMKVAIEFCIEIELFTYLFTELATLFERYGLEGDFINTLRSYILTEKLKQIPIPRMICDKLVNYYISKDETEVLEKIILFLNLEKQDLECLASICLQNKMFSALIYIKGLTENTYQYMEPPLYMRNEMRQLKKASTVKPENPENLQADDLKMKTLISSHIRTRDANKSYTYLGYKILWYINKCFSGERFPKRFYTMPFSTRAWASILYTLLMWLFMKEGEVANIQELMVLDVKAVFNVLASAFENPSTRLFLSEPESFDDKMISTMHYKELLENLLVVAKTLNSSKVKSMHYYKVFLARVASYEEIKLDKEIYIETAEYLMKSVNQQEDLTKEEMEALVLGMITNCKDLDKADIKRIVEEANKGQFVEIEVYLLEIGGNYDKCFTIYLNAKDKVACNKFFAWINKIHEECSKDSAKFTSLQNLIQHYIEQIVNFLYNINR